MGFYIHPFEGYECTEVIAESEGEAVSVTLGEDQRYEFVMPESSVILNAEFEKIPGEENEEAEIFNDGEEAEAVSTSARSTAVKAVAANYKMRPEYAFAYAFRKGKTKLTEVQGLLQAFRLNWMRSSVGPRMVQQITRIPFRHAVFRMLHRREKFLQSIQM